MDAHDTIDCPWCNAEQEVHESLTHALGSTFHFICKSCGSDFSRTAPTKDKAMELMTPEIAEKLHANDQSVIEHGSCGDDVVVKYFNPCGAQTWHIVSGTPIDGHGEPCDSPDDAGDWHLFGLCNLGDDQNAELGYLLLSDLKSIELPGGLGIERDLHYSGSLKAEQAACRERAGK